MWRLGGLAIVLAAFLVLPGPIRADGEGVVTVTVTARADVAVELIVPDRKILTGNPVLVEVVVDGPAGLSGTVTLKHPSGVLLHSPKHTTVTLNDRPMRLHLQVCSEAPGSHLLLASFESDGIVTESLAELLVVTEKKNSNCPPPWKGVPPGAAPRPGPPSGPEPPATPGPPAKSGPAAKRV